MNKNRAHIVMFISTLICHYTWAQNYPEYVFSGGKAVLGKNVWQTDLGINGARIANPTQVDIAFQFGQYINLKYGVSTGGHINVNYNFSQTKGYVSDVVQKNSGAYNLNLGYKQAVWDNVSLQAILGLSNQMNSFSDYSIQLQAIAEHALSSRISWQNNLGLSSNLDRLMSTVNYLSGLTYSFPLPLDLIFEVYGSFNERAHNYFSNLGVGYYFSNNFMTEVYFGVGNPTTTQNLFASINIYYRILPLKDN